MAGIAIGIACAYCYGSIVFRQGPIEQREIKGKARRRGGEIATVKCPHCDSRFTVHLVTKRKSKGARLRATEAKRAEDHRASIASAIARNREIAAKLLAMPGCTCAAKQAPDSNRWDAFGYGESPDSVRERKRAERLAEHGHLFGSCSTSQGIPGPPHHDQKCPCRNTRAERVIRGLPDDVDAEGAA